jgi:hypothetical protein
VHRCHKDGGLKNGGGSDFLDPDLGIKITNILVTVEGQWKSRLSNTGDIGGNHRTNLSKAQVNKEASLRR